MAYYLMGAAGIEGKAQVIPCLLAVAAAATAVTGIMLAPMGTDAAREEMIRLSAVGPQRDVHMEDYILNAGEPKMATPVLFAVAFLLVVAFLIAVHFIGNKNGGGGGLDISIVSVLGGVALIGTAGLSTHIITKMSISDFDGNPWAMTIMLCILSVSSFGVVAYKALGGMINNQAGGEVKKNLMTFLGTGLAVISAATLTGGCFEMLTNQFTDCALVLFVVSGVFAAAVAGMCIHRQCKPAAYNQQA